MCDSLSVFEACLSSDESSFPFHLHQQYLWSLSYEGVDRWKIKLTKVGGASHDPMPSGRTSTTICLLLQAYSTSPYGDVPSDVSACKESCVYARVYCVCETWIPYLKVVSVSPLPDDATTGIVHCDAPLPELLYYYTIPTLFLSCYTIPTHRP